MGGLGQKNQWKLERIEINQGLVRSTKHFPQSLKDMTQFVTKTFHNTITNHAQTNLSDWIPTLINVHLLSHLICLKWCLVQSRRHQMSFSHTTTDDYRPRSTKEKKVYGLVSKGVLIWRRASLPRSRVSVTIDYRDLA